MTRYSISLVNGDGIGPDLANSATMLLNKISDTCDIKFDIVDVEAGDNALVKYNKALPDFSFDAIKIRSLFEGTSRRTCSRCNSCS